MITAPANYVAASSPQHIVADWLLELAYDDTPPGTLYFSTTDREITNHYAGNVLEWGEIEESIDIANSTATTSDITIVLANKWSNANDSLAEELFGGTKKFLNQDVTIRSWLLGCAATSDCLTIYVGRLVDIQHDSETITLTIEKRSPWDRVKVGKEVSTKDRVPFPRSYGDYTANVSTVASKDFVAGKDLYPLPVNEVTSDGIVCLLPTTAGPISGANLHYYEPSLDIFIPLDPVNTTVKSSYQGGFGLSGSNTLKRGFDYRPSQLNSDDPDEFNVGHPAENAIDGNTATFAQKTFDDTGTISEGFSMYVDIPAIKGRLTDIDISVKYAIVLGPTSGVDASAILQDRSYGGSPPEVETIAANTTPGTTITGSETIHGVSGYETVNWFNSDRYSANNTLPDYIQLLAGFIDVIPGEAIAGNVKIYDIILRIASEVDFSSEETAGTDKVNNLARLYTGSNGFGNKWTGGTGLAIYPHQIYRDMLQRYTSWDATSEDHVEVNGVDWSTWASSGRDWDCRWWALEQKSLLDVLAQLQFEGGFLWIFDVTTSGVEARVIFVKSSYAAGDIAHTLDGDYLDAKVSLSPFSEIVTKRTFNFQRHPADDSRYLQDTYKINTNRGDWNLDTEENAIEQNLDFLTTEADVDDLLTHYDNIVGEPKIITVTELIDPSTWNLQVGDIVKFSNMEYEPYGKAWTDMYFMVVGIVIGVDKYIMTAREVG